MSYTLLIIDDDEAIHILAKSLLGKLYSLVHARNGQDAIDILSEKKIDLILSDIHMPNLTGLELLESLRSDQDKKKIPVLIMTGMPSVEKEKKAYSLGASHFISKSLFTKYPQKIVEQINMKLVTNIVIDHLEGSLEESKNKLVMSLMDTALNGLFKDTAHTLCSELRALLYADFVGMWVFGKASSQLINFQGSAISDTKVIRDITGEPGYEKLVESRQPFFSNHVYNEDETFFKELATEQKLPAEIVVPLFSVNEQGFLVNEYKIPEESAMFGAIIIKRSGLISSTEFELTSKLVIQAGTILWRLYHK
ncbi:MAG: response regulator [Balneolaceae bacterium]|nr:response regulator [Balneolaceae bacterium]